MLTVGSLFTGFGGFDLGLERAGMRVVWQCEPDVFCQRVLTKHWPGIPIYPDITRLRGAHVERPDVLAGGFPCQGLSNAGLRLGLLDPRSGLWSEYARLVGELRPRYVIVENVAALLVRGVERVLGDLAALGYDAEWDCLPASAFGAPHQRDRIWLVAYPCGGGLREFAERIEQQPAERRDAFAADDGAQGAVADAARLPEARPEAQPGAVGERARAGGQPSGAGAHPDADGGRRQGRRLEIPSGVEGQSRDFTHGLRDADQMADAAGRRGDSGSGPESAGSGQRSGRPRDGGGARGDGEAADADRERQQGAVAEPATGGLAQPRGEDRGPAQPDVGGVADGVPAGLVGSEWWESEPDVPRVSEGIPDRAARLRGLGNALVPQIAWWIGSRIVSYEDAEMGDLRAG